MGAPAAPTIVTGIKVPVICRIRVQPASAAGIRPIGIVERQMPSSRRSASAFPFISNDFRHGIPTFTVGIQTFKLSVYPRFLLSAPIKLNSRPINSHIRDTSCRISLEFETSNDRKFS
jgi:hypothetical protein